MAAPDLLRMLSVERLSGIARFVERLEASEETGDPCLLDLAGPAGASDRSLSAIRLDTTACLTLANLLVGRFREVELNVRLPSNRGLNLQLARGGIFFSLSNRDRVGWVDGTPSEWQRLAMEWHEPFHPDDVEMFREALAADRDLTRNDWVIRAAFQRYLLSVIGINHRPPSAIQAELDRVAGRWLSSRLRVRHQKDLVAILLDCSEIFYEIQVNIADHARLSTTAHSAALGQIFATLGGGRESHNRLYLTSLDNGVGIATTVRSRFHDRPRSDEEAVSDAVAGRLPGHGAGRGIGLSRVREVAENYRVGLTDVGGASAVRIVTGDGGGSCVSLDWRSGAPAAEVTGIGAIPVQGTIVVVCLGLEKRTDPRDLADQLELTFHDEPVGV